MERIKPKSYHFIYLAYLLFFMMLFVPTTYQQIKAPLLGVVLLAVAFSTLWKRRLHVHKSIGMWTLFMVTTGLVFMTLGVINNAPGALRVGTVYLLWPVVYTVLLSGIDSKKVVDDIFKLLIISLIAIALYSILYLLHTTHWLADMFYFELDMGQGVGIYEGYVEYNLYNISSLIFLLPFCLSLLIMLPPKSTIPVYWLWIALLLGLAVAILSGRRAVWLVLVISPFVILLMRMFVSRKYRRVNSRRFKRIIMGLVITIGALLFLGVYLMGLDFYVIFGMLEAGFNFSNGSASESARAEQFFELLKAWQDNIFFGAGHGAGVANSIRSTETPWAYELSYVALLFQTGLVGFFCYGVAIFWIFWMGVKIIGSNHWLNIYMVPVLVGLTCFLVANATNPYLVKFDYIWVIFLPVALINIWLLDNRQGLRVDSCQLN